MHNGISTGISIALGYYIIAHVALAKMSIVDYGSTHDVTVLAQAGIECVMALVLAGCMLVVWLVNISCGITELGSKLEKKSEPLEERPRGTETDI